MKSNKRKPETVHKQTGTTHKQTETLKKGKGRGKQGGKVEPRREGEINIEQASYPAWSGVSLAGKEPLCSERPVPPLAASVPPDCPGSIPGTGCSTAGRG